jgi:hypothetical protein
MEFGDFAMMRRMLLGVRRRAEGVAVTPDSVDGLCGLGLALARHLQPWRPG